MWFVRFKKAFLYLLFPWLLALLIQAAGRIYLLLTYASNDIYTHYHSDIVRMFTVGSRFDIRVASILYGILLVIAMVLAVSERSYSLWRKGCLTLAMTGTVMIGALSVTNVYFYKTYERAIDLFIFGIIDDDTKAILITLWQDYPVVTGVVLFIVGNYLLYLALRWWQRKCDGWRFKSASLLVSIPSTLVMLALVFVGVRGSVDTFPLRQSDTQVSEVKLLNMLTPSAGMALDWAYKDYKRNSHFDAATDDDGRAILSAFFGRPTEPDLSVFSAVTKDNPVAKAHPPHVVFAVMESMGEHLLSFDNPQRDLLGALRPHWQNDLLFKRFVSEGDGTIDTLSRLFVRSPMENITQSTAQNVDFRSNMLKPYLQNGYKVVFVTSGNGAWRNLNQFLPHLGVSEFVEQNKLKSLYPEAQISTWGLPDEYMFRYIERRLSEADRDGEHLLIISMSTTHHPPYRVPAGHNIPVFSFTEQEQQRLAHLGDDEQLAKIFGTLRYTNDQLGKFLDWVKSQPLREHTIVAITGDHNIRGIGYPDPSERVFGHAVPFYLYVPQPYLAGTDVDADRAGSHKDIWPTLYNLSLSNAQYYQTGCDLLAKEGYSAWCFGYNPEVIFDSTGAYSGDTFRPWVTGSADNLTLAEPQTMTPEQAQLMKQRQMITPLLKWQLNRQVHDGK
jgi:phosphoglycerol transferase MdoB-like AlkP superfamily enzyme